VFDFLPLCGMDDLSAFEFDAPKFQNFDQTPYRKRTAFIETLLEAENNGDNLCEEYMDMDLDSPASSEPDIDWFQLPHSSHELPNPASPPVPLITPVLCRLGLGSPGRVIKSTTSSEKSSNRTEYTPLRSRQTNTINFSPLRLQSPLRKDLGSSYTASSVTKSASARYPIQSRLDLVDEDLSRSPSPPRLNHDISTLENEKYMSDLDFDRMGLANEEDEGHFSRRNSDHLSDFDLTRDELIDMSSRVTNRQVNVTMRPQRVLVDRSPKNSSSPILKTVSKATLCPPPKPTSSSTLNNLSVRKPERPVVNRVLTKHINVQATDIKKILSEHNQRVRRR
jgi:hypothetical protein